MHGMANGLLLAHATMNGTHFEGLEAPAQWKSDVNSALDAVIEALVEQKRKRNLEL